MQWLEQLERRQLLSVVSISTPNRVASEPGQNIGIFVIERDSDFDDPLDVRVRISGAAENGDDYEALDDEVTILAGKRRLRIRVTPLDDNLVEPTEGVRLTLRTGAGYTINDDAKVATVKIRDNDVMSAPLPTVTVEATDSSAAEQNRATGVFTVRRTGDPTGSLRVNFHLSGTAQEGVDFDAVGAFVDIPEGQQSATVTIRPIDDDLYEDTEYIELEIDPSDTYIVGQQKEDDVTIADNEEQPTSRINWSSAKASPIRRFEAPSVVIDGKVYVFGGWRWDNTAQVERAQQRVDMYDPSTDTWSQRANLPTKLTHAGVAVDGNKVYFVGGFVGDDPGVATNDIWIYDAAANDWDKASYELPETRGAGGAAILDGRLHFFGGSTADRVTDSGKHWAISLNNPSAGWETLQSLPNPRHHFSTVDLDGKIYVFGGQHNHDAEVRAQDNTAHVYDPATNQWSALRNLPATLSHAEPGTFVREGRIVIAGGMTDTEDRDPVDDVLEYDPVTNTYRQLTPLPVALVAPVVQLVNGKLFVTGGNAASGGEQSTSYIGTFV